MLPPPPTSTLFPYTTLFRSVVGDDDIALARLDGDRDDLVLELARLLRRLGLLLGGDSELVLLRADRKSTRLNSSHVEISYAVFCLQKKNRIARGSGVLSAVC